METDWRKQLSSDGLVRRMDELIADGETKEQIQLMIQGGYETAAHFTEQPQGLTDLLNGRPQW